jgi:hypothetical protein
MQVVHEVCCGLDVHKKSVTACVLWAAGRRRQTRAFGTFTRELLELRDWLRACGDFHEVSRAAGPKRQRTMQTSQQRAVASKKRTGLKTGHYTFPAFATAHGLRFELKEWIVFREYQTFLNTRSHSTPTHPTKSPYTATAYPSRSDTSSRSLDPAKLYARSPRAKQSGKH